MPAKLDGNGSARLTRARRTADRNNRPGFGRIDGAVACNRGGDGDNRRNGIDRYRHRNVAGVACRIRYRNLHGGRALSDGSECR